MANEEKTLEQLQEELTRAQKAYYDAKKLDEQKKREEEERKMAELALVKDKRKKEIDDAIDNAVKLIKKYTEDYGSFSITDNINDLSFLFSSKPFGWFL